MTHSGQMINACKRRFVWAVTWFIIAARGLLKQQTQKKWLEETARSVQISPEESVATEDTITAKN